MMTQPIAQEGVGFIGTILHKGQMVFFQKCQHLIPGHREQGADQLFPLGSDASQALQPRAPHQVQQHGFGVVISGVGGGDGAIQGGKIGIPGLPGSGLQAFFSGHHITVTHKQRNIELMTKRADEGFIPVRFFAPEVVVKMSSGQFHAQFFFQ